MLVLGFPKHVTLSLQMGPISMVSVGTECAKRPPHRQVQSQILHFMD